MGGIFRGLSGRGRLTESNVKEAMRDIRTALLEADVNVTVAKSFCDTVLEQAMGQQVLKTLRPEQVIVKIVHDQLVKMMGVTDSKIPFVIPPPTIILMAGLQGSGKTTTCGKLAKFVIAKAKRPLLVAADLKRPAAIDQLEVIGAQVGTPVYTERGHQNPVKVCRNGILHARKTDRDVVILDTAGRLAIDKEMMSEIARIAEVCQPHQILLVLDAMTGQDALNTATAFNERLELDGAILTKFDSDTRGGAAMSFKTVTDKPIKFIGIGEKMDALEPFYPDRLASRILGMGDVVSLVEQAQEQYDSEEAAKIRTRMAKGTLNLEDFLDQVKKIKNMGSMKGLLQKLPGMSDQLKDADIDDSEVESMEAIILSMTRKERQNPAIIDHSRRRRIAQGSGTEPQDVSGLVKQFNVMKDMMKATTGQAGMDRLKSLTDMGMRAMMGDKMPKMKGRTAVKRRSSSKDKRKRRKRR